MLLWCKHENEAHKERVLPAEKSEGVKSGESDSFSGAVGEERKKGYVSVAARRSARSVFPVTTRALREEAGSGGGGRPNDTAHSQSPKLRRKTPLGALVFKE